MEVCEFFVISVRYHELGCTFVDLLMRFFTVLVLNEDYLVCAKY